MEPKPKMSPKDFFLHLGSVIALYVSAVSLLVLLFRIIESVLRDALTYLYDPYSSGIRWAIAFLIIVTPVFFGLSRLIVRDYARDSAKLSLSVRKWLIYVTLFIAGIVIAGDLVAVVYRFLEGEITARFIMKVLAVLVVTGLIFGYYILEVKRASGNTRYRPYYAWAAGILVLASIITGFLIMGSPQSQRERRFDERRIESLNIIQSEVAYFWQQKERLPVTPAELEDPLRGFIVPKDPENDKEFVYKKISDLSFELCAAFQTDTSENPRAVRPGYDYFGGSEVNWQHGIGEACFTRTIDPERFPSVKSLPLR